MNQSHVYYSNRAQAYLHMRMYSQALDDCQKAIEMEPEFEKPYYRKAKALLGLIRFEESYEALEIARKVDQNPKGNEKYYDDLLICLEVPIRMQKVFDSDPKVADLNIEEGKGLKEMM